MIWQTSRLLIGSARLQDRFPVEVTCFKKGIIMLNNCAALLNKVDFPYSITDQLKNIFSNVIFALFRRVKFIILHKYKQI